MVVGVVNQPVRKQTTLFTRRGAQGVPRGRRVAQSGVDNVEVVVFSNLVVEIAREQGAGAIVKGLRAISDFEYEFEMNQLNRKLAPDIESVYIIASPELQLPLLDRREGDGHLRRRRLRPGPGVAWQRLWPNA